jgi:NitT/TauT family transport system ATP-binding protein
MEAVIAPAPASARIIHIEDLGLAFEQDGRRTEVLRGLDLDICAGEFIAIVGASGVGKSTLLRVLMDLAKPTAGRVTITPDPNAERPMAMVFQDARLLPWRRVLSNVMFGLEKTSLSKAERVTRATEALSLVGLAEMAARWPHQLSGGQRQRVALARALAVRPSILLMDEPFSALDVATRENLQDELIRIRAETGRTILFVTHDIDEAVYMADKVVALGGKPGVVRSNRKIDVPRPRRRGSIALAEISQDVRIDITADHRDPDFVI